MKSSNASRFGIKWRRLIHKPLATIFKLTLKHKIKLMRNDFTPNGKPTIFAFTHVCKDDVAVTLCCLRYNAYVLAGYHRGLSRSVDGMGLRLNGVVWVDRGDKASRAEAMEKVKNILCRGGDILIAPEAAWNLSPNIPMLNLWWGVIDMAVSTGANIVPIALDLVNDKYCIIIGENFCYKQYPDKANAIAELRDVLATMAWELIEMKPMQKRSEITEKDWVDFTQNELARAPYVNRKKEESFVFRPKGEISLGELLANMYGTEYKSMAVDYEDYKRVEKLIDNWTKTIKVRK